MDYYPQVVQAIPGEGYSVYAYFSDGTVHLYDASHLIERGGVFAPLRDKTMFDSALTVLNETVAWDLTGKRDTADCIDIAPESVYAAPVAADPLKDIS